MFPVWTEGKALKNWPSFWFTKTACQHQQNQEQGVQCFPWTLSFKHEGLSYTKEKTPPACQGSNSRFKTWSFEINIAGSIPFELPWQSNVQWFWTLLPYTTAIESANWYLFSLGRVCRVHRWVHLRLVGFPCTLSSLQCPSSVTRVGSTSSLWCSSCRCQHWKHTAAEFVARAGFLLKTLEANFWGFKPTWCVLTINVENTSCISERLATNVLQNWLLHVLSLYADVCNNVLISNLHFDKTPLVCYTERRQRPGKSVLRVLTGHALRANGKIKSWVLEKIWILPCSWFTFWSHVRRMGSFPSFQVGIFCQFTKTRFQPLPNFPTKPLKIQVLPKEESSWWK